MQEKKIHLDRFYPIVPDIVWLKRIVPLGPRTIQLRLKSCDENEITAQIDEALQVTAKHNCDLIVNDHWQQAIDLGAKYLHLGQEDLAAADVGAIERAGLLFGVSTHDRAELETALRAKPAYVALGPIYETKLKKMTWRPQGLEKIAKWRARIGELPLVAIGGLTPERASLAIAAGATSAAVITDFITHPDPEKRVGAWLEWGAKSR